MKLVTLWMAAAVVSVCCLLASARPSARAVRGGSVYSVTRLSGVQTMTRMALPHGTRLVAAKYYLYGFSATLLAILEMPTPPARRYLETLRGPRDSRERWVRNSDVPASHPWPSWQPDRLQRYLSLKPGDGPVWLVASHQRTGTTTIYLRYESP